MELTITQNGALYGLQHGASKKYRSARRKRAIAAKMIYRRIGAGKFGGSQNSNDGNMLHLIWYIIVGLIAGLVAKSVMHTHLTLLWTLVLGIVGSLVGGCVTHIFSRPKEGAQFIRQGSFSPYLAPVLVLFVWYKLKLHL